MEEIEAAQTFSLLGQSQTLLGVILTLVVLCIFLDENSNFIHRLLKEQSDKFIEILVTVRGKLDDRLKGFFGYIAEDTEGAGEEKTRDKKAEDEFWASLSLFNYQTRIAGAYPRIERMMGFKEPIMASLYVFGYSIIIFILDEVGRFFTGSCDWLIYGVNIFTLTSILFWVVIWTFFWNFDIKSKTEFPLSDQKRRNLILRLNKLSFWPGALIKLIIYVGLYWLLFSFIPWQTVHHKDLLAILIALIPVGLVGVIRTYLFDRRGYYTHPQILGHVFGIFLYSVIITVIWQYTGKIAYLGNGFLTDTKWTAFLIILFALFNGIILPYALPYRKAYCIFKKAIKSYKG